MASNDSPTPSRKMVTFPNIYPLWRTRRPVVLVLVDPFSKSNDSDNSMDEDGGNNKPNPSLQRGVFCQHYRYLVVTLKA